ncbi:MAG TPA: ABC transporter ATP-binding protein [Gemmataceae bacterium]|nr:ABC transporter ATP-binding protein [Gemmataceae bacterium]
MTAAGTDISWPASRLGEAMEALGRDSGLGVKTVPVEWPPEKLVTEGGEQLGRWIEAAARWLDLEAEAVEVTYADVPEFLRHAGPAILRIVVAKEAAYEIRFLVLVAGDRKTASLLTSSLTRVRLAIDGLRALLCREEESSWAGLVDEMFTEADIPRRRRQRARQALLDELLATTRVSRCWLIRSAPETGLMVQIRQARFLGLLLRLVTAHACEYGLWILSWWLLGWMTLQGRVDQGWLLGWLLLLLTLIPCRLLATSAGGRLAIQAGALLKRRLLFGALRLEADEIRHLGVGHLLGRTLESGAVESAALTGGLLSLTAVIELILAGSVLGAGAGSWSHVTLLLVTAFATSWLGLRYYRQQRRWTGERLELTHDLVEQMVGHRTRLAQEARAHWNKGEDQALERYLNISRNLDGAGLVFQVLVPRGWLLAGLLGLAPAFLAGNRSTAALAVGVGGVLLAFRAFQNLVAGLDRLTGAAIAWERIHLFWEAAARRQPIGQPRLTVRPTLGQAHDRSALLDARDLVYRYRDRSEAVLQGAALRVCAGDRLLLEGPSGGGKSTLAALLAGCRRPDAGLLLLGGLDYSTLGAEGWRQRVVLVPQFHENHVFMGTFAFNALLGRGWPPREADLEEVERICRALELGPLLDRMPAGLQQQVGETGWQLSHGEKSRLYIARALLQRADLLILDESFAALDPHTLQKTLALVLEWAPTVLVIAHP